MSVLLRVLVPTVLLPLAVAAVPARHAAADTGPWTWPLSGTPVVLRAFDPPAQRWLAGHRGVDLAAEPGDPVLAAGAGRVGFAGTVGGVPVVTVVHGTLRTTYLPVAPLVRKGEEVHAGQPIGHLAEHPRHCAPRPCLHWGLLLGRDYMDPLSLLGEAAVRLLPLTGDLSRPRMGLLVDAGQPPDRDVRVDLGARQRRMAEDLLHAAQVSTPVEQMGGGAVPQPVRTGARHRRGGGVDVAAGGALPQPAAAGPQKKGATAVRGRPLGAAVPQPPVDSVERGNPHGHHSFPAAFAEHPQGVPFPVHVVKVQPAQFRNPDRSALEDFHHGAAAQHER